MTDPAQDWPELPFAAWRDTAATLHLWTQIVGKVRLALAPWMNHGWQVPLYVTARGLGTSPVPFGREIFEIEFDFVNHRLSAWTSSGKEGSFALEPQTVAAFHARMLDLLGKLGISVRISEMPNEFPDPVPFPQDRIHASYDPDAAHRLWRALVRADRVFKLFRSSFLGKASPVQFFWGSFDLAVFPGGPRRSIPAACRDCRTRSPARPIRTR